MLQAVCSNHICGYNYLILPIPRFTFILVFGRRLPTPVLLPDSYFKLRNI
jgi:hypothetical protein